MRSNLLFAKSVLLVEGDAEEMLIPILIKKALGLSVDELGISVINIRSTGFKNVAILFDDLRIRKRCSIVTDLDAIFFDVTPYPADSEALARRKRKAIGSQKAGADRKVDLDTFVAGNPWLATFYATHTFEVDLISSGNQEAFAQTVGKIYKAPSTIDESVIALRSGQLHLMGLRALMMAEQEGKGWFAIMLADALNYQVVIPMYIQQAILFTYGGFSRPVIVRILQYRAACLLRVEPLAYPRLAILAAEIERFQLEEIDLIELKAAAALALPGDSIHPFLAGIV